ncbi:thioredoxin domain-containing protein [Maritimibacter sp. DP07]|uniref:Thioredoxin domain-containing protein n=1 Tax=Maritimibacter harenae TaxID=2606218 RepID=A0A845M9J4_9RHOB|nr:DsbA family protein [Maritimibacter harenae]MZR13171.1 thioredoxin domain-containing protein [Maritimibacter harenae]
MTRLVTAAALAMGLATPAIAFDIGAMTEDERTMFRDEVRAYLLDNPEVLMEAIQVLESRQAAQAEANDVALVAANSDALFNDGYSHVGGNPDGDVTMVEFVDYRCGYCRKAFPELNELIESDGNIRIIYKEFPILGEESVTSSRFAIATQLAHGEEAYGEMHDALMTLRANATEEVLARLADDMGYDSQEILAKMDDPEVDRRIGENHGLAQRLQISGTPTFVIGDQMLRGYVPLDGMRDVVEQVREQDS